MVFSRSFEIDGLNNSESVLLAQSPQGGGVGQLREVKGIKLAVIPRSKKNGDASVIAAAVVGEDASIGVEKHQAIAKVKAGSSRFSVLLWEGPEDRVADVPRREDLGPGRP